jgi:ABC-type sugar transport system substrate-binding protein
MATMTKMDKMLIGAAYVAAERLTKAEEVMAQMATALEKCDKHFQHGAGYVCNAIAAYGAWKAWAARRREGRNDM